MTETKPSWLDQFAWSLLVQLVAVFLATALLWALVGELRRLLWLLVVSSFFAVAMIPGVEHLHRRGGWRRGAAVALIYLSLLAFVVLMISILSPAIDEFATR